MMSLFQRIASRLIVVTCLLAVTSWAFMMVPAIADDDHSRHTRKGKSTSTAPKYMKTDERNEATGKAAAWLFAIANITIAVSLVSKVAINLSFFSTRTKDWIKRINQSQKRYGMPVHYLINPLALGFACVHFFLSNCRSTFLPEWGLLMMASLVVIGILVKFRISPKAIRKWTYLVHTSPMVLVSVLLILIVGHSVMD